MGTLTGAILAVMVTAVAQGAPFEQRIVDYGTKHLGEKVRNGQCAGLAAQPSHRGRCRGRRPDRARISAECRRQASRERRVNTDRQAVSGLDAFLPASCGSVTAGREREWGGHESVRG